MALSAVFGSCEGVLVNSILFTKFFGFFKK